MSSRLVALAAVAAVLVSAGPGRADYQFVFEQNGNVVTSIQESAGSNFSVQVYLMQTGGTTGLSATGLNQAGIQINGYNNSNVTVSSITPNDTNNGGSFNAVNTTTSINNSSSTAILTEGYTNPNTGLKGTSVYLGTYNFTAGSAGTTSTVTAVAYPGEDNNVLADGTVIDSMIANSNLAITVTAVPEPGSLLLVSLLGGAIAGRFAQRRFRATAA